MAGPRKKQNNFGALATTVRTYAEKTTPREMPEGYAITGFEQLPGESEEAFASYVAYRDMGPGRTVAAVADQLGRNLSVLANRSMRERWHERIGAYERFLIAEEQAAIRKAAEARARELVAHRTEVQRRDWEVGEVLHNKAMKMLQWPLARTEVQQGGKTIVYMPAKWSQYTAVQMFQLASDLIRRSTEMPTTYQQVDANIALQSQGGIDTSAMSDEERERFAQAQVAAAQAFAEIMEHGPRPEATARIVEAPKPPDWYVPSAGPRAFADEDAPKE